MILLPLLTLAAMLAALFFRAVADDRPNVLLITVDCLRADRGVGHPLSPAHADDATPRATGKSVHPCLCRL